MRQKPVPITEPIARSKGEINVGTEKKRFARIPGEFLFLGGFFYMETVPPPRPHQPLPHNSKFGGSEITSIGLLGWRTISLGTTTTLGSRRFRKNRKFQNHWKLRRH